MGGSYDWKPTLARRVCQLHNTLFKGLNGLLGLAGNADFIISHSQEPGWVGTMLDWLLNPPPWAIVPTIALGLSFILWDAKRQRVTSPTPSAEPNLSDHSKPNAVLRIENLTKPALIERVEMINRRLRHFRISESASTDVELAKIALLNLSTQLVTAIIKRDANKKTKLESEIKDAETRVRFLEESRVIRQPSEFKAQFANDVAQIRAELARRIGRPIGGADDPMRDLLENGIVTDEALQALGDHLHEMADRLPN